MTVGQKLLEYMLEKHGNMKNNLIPNTSKLTKPKPSLYNSVVNKLNEFGLNPKNWSVEDLSNLKTRGEAFNTARNKGEKEFVYKGTRYNTNYAGTAKQQLKETGIINEQIQDRSNLNKNFNNNIYPYGYGNPLGMYVYNHLLNAKDDSRILLDNVLKNKIGVNEQRLINATKNELNVSDDRVKKLVKNRMDALNMYSGVPQKNNTFTISNYVPSISKEKNKTYYTFNNENKNELEKALLNWSNNSSNKKNVLTDTENTVMGDYTVSKGKDKRGEYISYYDKWDLEPKDFGKPFEMYDRIYTRKQDDKYVKMNYTDDELSKLNSDKKNFDTLALQRELNNRGYKLPKSTKKEGGFDGILGDETKQALLDWQNKNKKMYGGKLLPSLNKL